MKSIIVATDFSVTGDQAMRYAVKAAYRSGARLVLLTLYSPPFCKLNASVSAASRDSLLTMQATKLQAVKQVIASTYALAVEFHQASGHFMRDVKQCVDLYGANTLVVGLARNVLEKDLSQEAVCTDACCDSTYSQDPRKQHPNINHIFFAPEIFQDMHYNMLLKVKKFAQQLGATVDHFHV